MPKQLSIMSSGLGTVKAIDIDTFFDYLQQQGRHNQTDERENFAKVSWVFRATTMRASALSRIPFSVTTTDGEPFEWVFPMKKLLLTIEADLCLQGAGYILKKETATALRGLQRLNPWTMKPVIDKKRGITKFEQRVDDSPNPKIYRPNKIVYFDHLYSPYTDLGAGISPAQVAGLSGKLVQNMSQYASAFFENGAIPAVVLETEHGVKTSQAEEVRTIWEKMLRGVSNAWSTIILQRGLKAHVIGNPTKDLAMPELEDSAKKQIAVAFGIPLGILEQEDVSHSTAESHHTTFWTDTIIPEAELLAEILQEHLFDGLDLKFAWRFQELEAIQAVEFKKAQGLSALLMQVNQAFMNGLVSLEEGRMIYQIGFSRMGFEEAARALEEELDQSQISIAAQQLMAQANAPPEEKPPKEGATKEIPLKKALGAAPKSVYRELARWRKTAPIRGKDFDSDIIPDHIRSQVNAMIDWVGAERAFDFLKQFDARMKIEEELREDIEKFLQEYERKMKQMFEKLDKDYQGDSVAVFHELDGVYFPAFVMDLQRTLTPHVESMVANTLSDISMGVGVAWSPAYVNKEAAEYVRNFTSLISGSISDTTKEAAQNAVAVTLETAGMTLEDAVRLMKHTFGEDRARLIAVTETTRGYSMAVTKAQSDLYSEGVTLSRVWHTGADELVCDICRPLDLAPEHMWSGQYPSGAPAHPNCRCVIGLSGKAKQLMDAEHTHRQLELSRWEAERQAILAAQQQASIAPPVMINSPFYSGKALRDLPVKEIHPMNSSADKGYFPSAVMVLDDGTPEGQVVILKPDFSPDPKSPEERIVGEALGYDLARMMGYDSFVPYTEFIQDPTRIRELETLWATLGRNDPPITGYSVQVWVDGFDRAKRAALMQAGGRSIMNVSLDKMDFAKMRWLDVLGANWDGHDENWGFMMPKDAQGNYDTAHPDWFNLISIDNGFAGAWSDRGLTISLQYFWADQTSAAGHVAAMCPIMNGAIGTDFAASDNITALELAKGLALKESNVAFDWVQNLYNSNGGGKAVEWSEAKWIDYNPNKDEYGSIYNTVMLISEQKHIAGVTANDTEFFSEVERLADDIKMQMDAAYAQGRLLLPRHFYLDSNGDLAVDDTR